MIGRLISNYFSHFRHHTDISNVQLIKDIVISLGFLPIYSVANFTWRYHTRKLAKPLDRMLPDARYFRYSRMVLRMSHDISQKSLCSSSTREDGIESKKVISLNHGGLPFSSASCKELDLGNTLLFTEDVIFFLEECARILIPGGRVQVQLEPAEEQKLFRDPRQCRLVTQATLQFIIDRKRLGLTTLEPPTPVSEGYSVTLIKNRDSQEGIYGISCDAENGKRLILDLGCGPNKTEGALGIDLIPFPGVDIVRNIAETYLPFDDDSVSGIVTKHFLEHVSDLTFVMNEIWRVCRSGAIVDIAVPTCLSPWAIGDPTHKRLFNTTSFPHYLIKEGYGRKGNFELVQQTGAGGLHVVLRVTE